MTLYDELVVVGIPIENHESDLYVPNTPEVRGILDKYPLEKKNARPFVSRTEPFQYMLDIPFAYTPWWENKSPRK